MTTVSQEQFRRYVAVQNSGVTNMFDIKTVGDLTGLDRETILSIMDQYGKLKAGGLRDDGRRHDDDDSNWGT